MTGRMESVENLDPERTEYEQQREVFHPPPPVPWKSLRDSHIPTAPTTTILSYKLTNNKTKGTLLLG